MAWITGAKMAAAVCDAGGLGTLAAATLQPDELRDALHRLRERTSRPFAVNIPLRLPTAAGALEVALSEEVPIVVCSAGDPLSWVPRLKEAGRIVLQVVFNREMAERAHEAGVDALIAMGAEAGGNLCPDELSTLVLVPHIVDSTGLPVVAAGGIADGRGFAAALALGAEGIQMGTRLLATRECTVHPKYKAAVLSAGDTATTVTGRSTGLEFRVLKNELASEILEMERRWEDRSTIDAVAMGALRRAVVYGDVEKGSVMMGQAAALIEGEVAMAELFRDITKEALGRIQGLYTMAKEGGEGVINGG
jgi:enoyl-[acyl-carrier protein] reductase II